MQRYGTGDTDRPTHDGSKENSRLATGRGSIAGESFSPSRGNRLSSPVCRRLYPTIREKAVSPHRARIELRLESHRAFDDHRPSPRVNRFPPISTSENCLVPSASESGRGRRVDRSNQKSGSREKDLAVIFYSAAKQRGGELKPREGGKNRRARVSRDLREKWRSASGESPEKRSVCSGASAPLLLVRRENCRSEWIVEAYPRRVRREKNIDRLVSISAPTGRFRDRFRKLTLSVRNSMNRADHQA